MFILNDSYNIFAVIPNTKTVYMFSTDLEYEEWLETKDTDLVLESFNTKEPITKQEQLNEFEFYTAEEFYEKVESENI